MCIRDRSKAWEEFKSENGIRVVQFTCVKKNVAQVTKMIKETTKDNCKENNSLCPEFDVTSVKQTFQWTINKDDSFQIEHVGRTITWKDGRYFSDNYDPLEALEQAYRNTILYDPSEESIRVSAQFYLLIYPSAKGGNNSTKVTISPPAITDANTQTVASDAAPMAEAATTEINQENSWMKFLGKYEGGLHGGNGSLALSSRPDGKLNVDVSVTEAVKLVVAKYNKLSSY